MFLSFSFFSLNRLNIKGDHKDNRLSTQPVASALAYSAIIYDLIVFLLACSVLILTSFNFSSVGLAPG